MEFSKERLINIIEDCLKLSDENESVEFKENLFQYDELGKRLCGLSNTACLKGEDYGFLIYGIEDETLKIKGTNFNPDKEKVGSAPFEFKLSQNINPNNISIKIEKINYNGFDLVLFIVPSAIEKPTTFKSKSYIRIGSGTTELSKFPDKERKIWNNVYNKNFEKQIAISGLLQEEIFELLDIDNFFELLNINKSIGIEETINYLIQNKIIIKSLSRYDITNLGGLLFAKKLSQFESIKSKGISVVVYDGNDKSANNKSHEGNKGYALGFKYLLKYIHLLIPSFEKIVDGRRIKINNYPEIAIREFVANALIHQDLSIGGMNPIIEIYKDRIEITNPGKPLIEVNRFLDSGISRNEDLSDLMRKMKFCEKKGGGVDKAIIAIEKERLPAPKILYHNNYTKVILYSLEKVGNLTKEDRIRACYFHCVIRYISKDNMTNSSFRERLGLPTTQTSGVSRIIKESIEKKDIKPFDPENKANKHQKYVPFWS